MDSSELEVEPYNRPNASRLEPHERFIQKMRDAGWPYHAIASRLLTDCEVSIGITALHDFCKRRQIKKGGRRKQRATAGQSTPRKPRAETEPASSREDKATDDDWDLVVPKTLSTWKSRGEDRPPSRDS